MSVDKKKLLEYIKYGIESGTVQAEAYLAVKDEKNMYYSGGGVVILQKVLEQIELGTFDANPIFTVDYWKRLAADQQVLKEKAEKERDEFRKISEELSSEHAYAKKEAIRWNDEAIKFKRERDEAQEERDHLLAANDEYQEKLRFEEEEEDPPICFKMDANGNLTRV